MEKNGFFKSKVFGYFLALFAVFVWGVTFVCTKTLLVSFSPFEVLLVRYLVAFVFMWVIHPKWEKIELKDNIYFALAGLTGVVVYQFAENTAVNFTTASNVSVIVSICPLFTAIIAQIFLKEKHITPWFLLGFVISICGVAMVCMNGKNKLEFNPKGDLIALVSAISWGFYSLFVSIINKKNYDSICATRRVFFFSLIFMIPIIVGGLFAGENSPMHMDFTIDTNSIRFANWKIWLNLVFLGFVASDLCFVAWNKACHIVGTVKISAGIYLIPVVTIIFSFFVLGEEITLMGGIGALITIAGLFISGKQKRECKQQS